MSPSAVRRRCWLLQTDVSFGGFGFVRFVNRTVRPFEGVNVSMLRSLIHSHYERLKRSRWAGISSTRETQCSLEQLKARVYPREDVFTDDSLLTCQVGKASRAASHEIQEQR